MIAIKIHKTNTKITSFNPWKMVRAGERASSRPQKTGLYTNRAELFGWKMVKIIEIMRRLRDERVWMAIKFY